MFKMPPLWKQRLMWSGALVCGGFPLVFTIYAAIAWRRSAGYALGIGLPLVLALAVAWALRGGRELKLVTRDLLTCTGLYCLLIIGGLLLVFAACALAGYLPYSDRPGPGWEAPHVPSWDEMGFYLDWELHMVPSLVLWAAMFWVLMEWLGWLRIPRWVTRVIGGVFCGCLTLLTTAFTGWYIALAAFPANMAGIFGLVFGIFVLPRFADDGKRRLPFWLRVAGALVPCLGVAAIIIWPFVDAVGQLDSMHRFFGYSRFADHLRMTD